MDALTQLHFLRPLWALAVLPVAALLLLAWNNHQRDGGGWRQVIDERLLQPLLVGQAGESKVLQRCLMGLALVFLAIALAGPSWRQLPEPVVQNERGLVLVADLTQSMLATDVAPSRLERARFKMRDLLQQLSDQPTGLIAFAGSAHVVAPVSDDVRTVENLLRALDPTLMPVSGSRLAPALKRAVELMRDGGSPNGDVLLLTDAKITEQDITAAEQLASAGLRLSVIGIGTVNGAPIPAADGQFVKRSNGGIVIASLDEPALKRLALAGGGRYRKLSDNNSDIAHLLENSGSWQTNSNIEKKDQRLGDSWEDAGYWFVLPVLLLLAIGARRGLLFSAIPGLAIPGLILASSLATTLPQPAQAQAKPQAQAQAQELAQTQKRAQQLSDDQPAETGPKTEPETERETAQQENVIQAGASYARSLFQNSNQRAADKMAKGDYREAANTFEDERWKASALYEAGDFEAAAAAFSKLDTADSHYNRGNALARSGNLEASLEAYQKALEMQPNMADAAANSQLVQQLLDQKKQEQEQKQKNDQQQDGEQGDPSDEKNQGDEADQSNDQNNEQSDSDGQDAEQEQNPDQQSDGPDSESESGEENQQQAEQNSGEEQQSSEQNAAGKPESPTEQQSEQQSAAQSEAGASDLESDLENEPDSLANEALPQPPEVTEGQADEEPGDDAKLAEETAALQEHATQAETPPAGQAMMPTEAGEPLTEKEQSLQQWLNRIPDDPGGLLRRKFARQQQRRQQTMPNSNGGDGDGDTRW